MFLSLLVIGWFGDPSLLASGVFGTSLGFGENFGRVSALGGGGGVSVLFAFFFFFLKAKTISGFPLSFLFKC